MSTVTLDELETNATTAALMERLHRLTAAVRRLEGQPATEDRDFALAANRQAHRHTVMALRTIAGGLPDEAAPDPIDEYKAEDDRSYHDWQASGPVSEPELFRGYGGGNPEGDPTLNGAFR